ncbi:heavy metal-associated isoprenylated plant protein 47-like isoform X2 [Syzygium oleosum]|uniref:heavy metal-associated isoprenylated plant protein 47-like isoform X2 n=1 Tax=Syzygium oleosum TaxID=219896 RepID=UPI0011D28442|nr:heavy metal-associated isoprenylated plant protein 47-like isoform X2 [Syzygium oleosum]
MTKKKVVVKVSMNGRNQKFPLFPNFRRQGNRQKALQIATAVPGFQSVILKGADQDVIEVTGEGVDAVDLTITLHKRVGYANLEMVNEVKEEKKPEKDEQPKPAEPPVVWSYPTYVVTEPTEPQSACCPVM